MIKLELSPESWREILKSGYSLDVIYALKMAEQEIELEEPTAKEKAILQAIERKGLITDKGLTLEGKELLGFLSSISTATKYKKKKAPEDSFTAWWKAYPSTDTFEYKGKKFVGSRGLKAKKDECKLKIDSILNEGEHTIEDLIHALELEVEQKKERSVKEGKNILSYMQNSLTYLNQRTFDPYCELVKQGHKAKKSEVKIGATDI